MTYISSTVPNLINGISQQPSAFKLATQAEFQLNGVSSVVHGLKKRPPSVHKSKASHYVDSSSFTHTLDYGQGEYYTVVVKDGNIIVLDNEGQQRRLDHITAAGNNESIFQTPHVLISATIYDHEYGGRRVKFKFETPVQHLVVGDITLANQRGVIDNLEQDLEDASLWTARWRSEYLIDALISPRISSIEAQDYSNFTLIAFHLLDIGWDDATDDMVHPDMFDISFGGLIPWKKSTGPWFTDDSVEGEYFVRQGNTFFGAWRHLISTPVGSDLVAYHNDYTTNPFPNTANTDSGMSPVPSELMQLINPQPPEFWQDINLFFGVENYALAPVPDVYYTASDSTTGLVEYLNASIRIDGSHEYYSPVTYLQGLSDPKTQLSATTIADHTYIVNKTIKVEKDTAKVTKRPYEGLVYVKNGGYATKYTVVVEAGIQTRTYELTTNDSTHEAHEASIATTTIAKDLFGYMVIGTPTDVTEVYSPSKFYDAGDIVIYNTKYYQADISTDENQSDSVWDQYDEDAWWPLAGSDRTPGAALSMWSEIINYGGSQDTLVGLPDGLSASLHGNQIRIWSTTTNFKLKATDDRGGTYMFAYKGQVDDFKKLPTQANLGFKITVAGNNEKQQDDYHVQYQDIAGLGKGVWKECPKDLTNYKINASTMPHVLIKEPDGTFHFKESTWDNRLVGDEDTNPFPSFVGQTLNDLFFYRNRLGLLAGENVILSEVGSFWNFFHTTTLVLLDSSPIDIAVSTDKQNELQRAVPFNTALMLFSDSTQFTLEAGQILAHDTVSVEVATRFDSDLRCSPVGKATFVFFAFKRGEYGGIREYYVAEGEDVTNADNITSHVPEFIEGAIQAITVSSVEDMVVIRADGKPNELYIYNYYWANKEKKQAAWHKWDLGAEVVSAEFVESELVLLVNRPTGTCVETINLSRDATSEVMDYGQGLLLDRRVEVSDDTPEPILPFIEGESPLWYNQKGEYIGKGITTPIARPPGDTFYAGIPYSFEYRFSEFLIRNEGRAVTPTKLKLKSINVQYDNASSFDVVVEPVAGKNQLRPSYSRSFAAPIGSSNTILNQVIIDSGKFKVPVWGDAPSYRVTLKNESVYPSSFQTAEWTATYSKHSKGT
jgi:hypothetical protein